MSEIKLKPCPFCGAQVAIITTMRDLQECANFEDEKCICKQYERPIDDCKYYIVVCNVNAGGCGGSSGYDTTAEKAAEIWNRRVGK